MGEEAVFEKLVETESGVSKKEVKLSDLLSCFFITMDKVICLWRFCISVECMKTKLIMRE